MVASSEPEWDEIDRAMFDAYLDWRADLHTCGRPLSESLYDPDSDDPDPDYKVGVEICRACRALDKDHADRAKDDAALREAGRTPESWRLKTVLPAKDVAAAVAASQKT